MNSFFNKHKPYWRQKQFTASVLVALLFLFGSLVLNNYANVFALRSVSNPVTDIILDNIPLVNVGPIIVYGAIGLISLIAFLILIEPKRVPFVIKSVALFVLIRAIFISLTHIAPFPGQILITGDWFSNLLDINGTADLFFSGHTGLPFLMMFIFWENNLLRGVFLTITIVFALAVLFGHLHYSIDVFGAFFITYAIYEISRKLFAADYHLFMKGLYAESVKKI